MASGFSKYFHILRATLNDTFFKSRLPGSNNLVLNVCHEPSLSSNGNGSLSGFLDSLKDGFVWNTPKKRKSIEWRMAARFGSKQWGTSKTIPMNRLIRVDPKTGDFFELGRLAPNQYKKVMDETEEIKKKIAAAFEVGQPKDKTVSVRYNNEKADDNLKDRIVVEMEKERPSFFSRNLITKTRTPDSASTSTTVRPSGLG